ncbi:MAG: histidine kinase N-terminal 7TM domain-containing protein [Anaerolineae bacterium]
MDASADIIVSLLMALNRALSSAIVILAFSLLVYILAHNLRSSVARSFSALIGCVCITYLGDVALFETNSLSDAVTWLKVQWIGIAFTPAAYLHFSDALLRTTFSLSRLRRWAVRGGYLAGFLLLPLAFSTELLVHDGIYSPGITQFRAGPLFGLFSIYFFAAVVWGAYNIYRARRRCLTSTSRRRMTYLAASFAAPALGVFPYLLVASAPSPSFWSQASFFTVLFAGNVGIALMIVLMAYSVAYFGVLTPDRVVRHRFVHYLLRGPLVATTVIFIIMAMPERSRILGLPRDMVLTTSIVAVIVLAQLAVNMLRPGIDRLVFRKDREEIEWIQELDRRLLTTTDLQQALENILTALCDILRVRNGFIVNVAARSGPRLEAQCGSQAAVETALSGVSAGTLLNVSGNGDEPVSVFTPQGDFWYTLLRTKSRDRILGLLGIEARTTQPDLTEDEQEIATALIAQAELALEDRHLQQDVFDALKRIIPEIERVQRLRGTVRYAGAASLKTLAFDNPVNAPDFTQMVRDALAHYWGGPQLSGSPLTQLRIVQEAMDQHDGNAARALRAVLGQAIDNLRPDGERRMTTAEWLLYNILELKFIQGMRVRDIAHRLAMSESDLYRKQRVAIQEVAQALAEMEQEQQKRVTSN